MRTKLSLESRESETEQRLTGISEREWCMSPSTEATSLPSGEESPPAMEMEELSLPDSPRTYHQELLVQPSELLFSHKDTHDDRYLNDSIFNISDTVFSLSLCLSYFSSICSRICNYKRDKWRIV